MSRQILVALAQLERDKSRTGLVGPVRSALVGNLLGHGG